MQKLLVADKNLTTDGVAFNFLQMVESPMPLLLVSRVEGYKFNEAILQLKGQQYCLISFVEYGWDWNRKEGHIWGKNTDKFDFLQGEEWEKLDDFIKENPPAVIFTRELLKEDFKDNRYPIEYPAFLPKWKEETKEEFDARPINCFHYFGRSHEYRLLFHAAVFENAVKNGTTVCDSLYHLNKFMEDDKNPNKFVSLFIPHYGRVEMTNIWNVNGNSKLSVSLFGCGTKCFRSAESPTNSIMVMQNSEIVYSYPWIANENCIMFPTDYPDIEVINEALKRPDLYDIYQRGLANIDNYRVSNYISNYIEPIIKQYA